MITYGQLKACMPNATEKNLNKFLAPLSETMLKYFINTAPRKAAFLAQLIHESGSLQYVREIASGQAYEGRKDLGNTEPGDGRRFKGRGLIQITGRANYKAVSEALGEDFVSTPSLLEEPKWAAMSAGWFWDSRKLNWLADEATEEAFRKITKRINGGYNGWEDRKKHYLRCMSVLTPIV